MESMEPYGYQSDKSYLAGSTMLKTWHYSQNDAEIGWQC
jgi:hypothetical protein